MRIARSTKPLTLEYDGILSPQGDCALGQIEAGGDADLT
jgi:hypothetical protein